MAKVRAKIDAARKLKTAHAQDALLDNLRQFFDDPAKTTFVRQLDFAEVFHRDAPVGRVPLPGAA